MHAGYSKLVCQADALLNEGFLLGGRKGGNEVKHGIKCLRLSQLASGSAIFSHNDLIACRQFFAMQKPCSRKRAGICPCGVSIIGKND
jgi:hypothetical protein